MEILNTKIHADLSAVVHFRQSLKSALANNAIEPHIIDSLVLPLSEWINNVIKHSTFSADSIVVIATLDRNQLTIDIRDNSSGFSDFNKSIDSVTDDILTEAHESGYGLYIIKSMLKDYHYIVRAENKADYNQFTTTLDVSEHVIKLKVAIVEDDDTVRVIVKKYLESKYDVVCYYNGDTFLEDLPNREFALVVCDIKMPGTNGLEVRKILASQPETDLIPFLFLTGSADEATETYAVSLGVDDFLHKPTNRKQLLASVNRILKRKASERANFGNLLDNQITSALRPTLPAIIGGFDCALGARNATAGGGDFTVHVSQENYDVIVLGDVMGHGINAKFFAHCYSGYIRGLLASLLDQFDLSTAFNHLSRLLMEDAAFESVIVTCIACLLDKKNKNTIQLLNAGHPRPLLLSENGRVVPVNVTGSLLGMDVNVAYELQTVTLNEQETLFIFTDGLFEIGDSVHDQQKNKHVVMDFLAKKHQTSLAQINQETLDLFDDLSGVVAKDDMTCLFLKPAK